MTLKQSKGIIINNLLLLCASIILFSCSGSNSTNPTTASPTITSLTPNNGLVGDLVTIAGTNLGTDKTVGNVSFNQVTAADITSWTDTEIKVKVPAGATTGNVYVKVNSNLSNGVMFTVNTVSTSGCGDYFPTSTGTWWIYERYLVDTLKNRTGSALSDSVLIVGSETVDSKVSQIMLTMNRLTGLPLDTSHVLFDGSKYWVHMEPIQLLKKQWLVMFDCNASTWTVGTQQLASVEFLPGYPLTGTLTITGANTGQTNITFNSQTIQAYKITISMSFTGTVKISVFDVPATFTQSTDYVVGKGIGLYHLLDGPIKVNASGYFTQTISQYPMFERTLTGASIK